MATTVNALLDKTIEYAYANNPTLFGGFDRQVIRTAFANALTSLFPKEVALSTVMPDYESVVLQLTSKLSEDPVWYDAITAATGQTLIRFVAAGITYSQFSIERALQEAFPQYASSDSSIYATTELLGVRVRRVIPATVTVQLTRLDAALLLELPALTPFTINNVQFFNREAIIFPIDIRTVDVVLAQGIVYTSTLIANGQPSQDIEIGDGTKDISDTDVYVTVGDRVWKRVTDGPWRYAETDEVFFETTSPSSNIMLTFGDNSFGKMPTINSVIAVKWVRTLGEVAHHFVSGLEVDYNGPSIDNQIEGITLTNITNARNMALADFYARMAPHMYSRRDRAVRRSDYRSFAVEYPGVKDALFRGQAELGPHKRSMMNVVGATLLTETAFNAAGWDAFVEYMQGVGIFQCEFLRMDPTPINVEITANVYCSQRASLSTVQQLLISNVQKLFQYRLGWIGYPIYMSDITNVLEGVGETGGLVEFVELLSPTTNLTLSSATNYLHLTNVTLNMKYTTRNDFTGRLDMS